MSFDFLYLGMN